MLIRGVSEAAMGEFKHLVITKFKEGVNVEEIVNQIKKMVSHIDSVNSFEWGHDVEGQDMLTQGFTHVFSMTFLTKEDITSFLTHPKHLEFSPTFSAAIDKIIVLDFPSILLKPPASPPQSETATPPPVTSIQQQSETTPPPPPLPPLNTPPSAPPSPPPSAAPPVSVPTPAPALTI